jgi:hypothetical protein
MRVLKLALKGPNKSAQGNALGLQARPWELDYDMTYALKGLHC